MKICKLQSILYKMTEERHQLYIREILKQLEEKKNGLIGMDISDKYLNGKRDTINEILSILQSEAITYRIDLKNLDSKY